MSGACDHAVEQIYFYIDKEISLSRRMRIRWHLRRCGDCCGAYDFEEGFKRMVRQKCQTEPSAELIQRLRTLIREEAGDDAER